MADVGNTNAPFGLRYVGTLNDSPTSGKLTTMYVPSTDGTAIGLGDPVAYAGSADANGVPTATRATSTAAVCGVMVGIKPYPQDLSLGYRKASTSQYILVNSDPNALWEIQEDSVGGAIAATAVGNTAAYILGTVDTTTGNGKTVLDSSDVGTSTHDLLIIGLCRRQGNLIGDYATWLVRLNLHKFINSSPGA
jgi:hypothetical protein